MGRPSLTRRLISLVSGRLGAEAVAAHTIAANVDGMTFMVPLALGMAVSIRVGFNVGAGDYDQRRPELLDGRSRGQDRWNNFAEHA